MFVPQLWDHSVEIAESWPETSAKSQHFFAEFPVKVLNAVNFG